MRERLSYANVMATIAVFAAIGGGAIAIGQSGGDSEIKACYARSGANKGDLRLLTRGQCTRKERPISWNQSGPTGAPGAPGAPGDPGAQGNPGAPGTPGTDGAAITARPSYTGAPFDTTSSFTPVALATNTWTQAANEVDMVVGSIRLNDATCVDPSGSRLFIQYFLDGDFLSEAMLFGPNFVDTTLSLPNYTGFDTPTRFAGGPLPIIPAPGAATARTLTASVRHFCGTSGSWHISSLDLNVVRFN